MSFLIISCFSDTILWNRTKMNKREQRWTKEQKGGKGYENMNISFFLLLKSKQMVWIYTSSTLILGLTKEEMNQ